MKLHRFYTDKPLQNGANVILDGKEAHHILHALKLQTGRSLVLFNGDNHDYHAIITTTEKRRLEVTIECVKKGISLAPLHTHLYLAISKGERMDIAIQKAVELGVSQISPIISDRTVVKLDEKRTLKRILHWQQIIISACEQCGRSDVPVLNDICKLSEISETSDNTRLVLAPNQSTKLTQVTLTDNIDFIIGPEGGLSDNEITYCANNKAFQPVSLGALILRTETAPAIVLSVLHTLKGDFLPTQ